MGGTNPIRVQSMTNTPTTDTEACVAQAIRIMKLEENMCASPPKAHVRPRT